MLSIQLQQSQVSTGQFSTKNIFENKNKAYRFCQNKYDFEDPANKKIKKKDSSPGPCTNTCVCTQKPPEMYTDIIMYPSKCDYLMCIRRAHSNRDTDADKQTNFSLDVDCKLTKPYKQRCL